jgi:hypothetical protein
MPPASDYIEDVVAILLRIFVTVTIYGRDSIINKIFWLLRINRMMSSPPQTLVRHQLDLKVLECKWKRNSHHSFDTWVWYGALRTTKQKIDTKQRDGLTAFSLYQPLALIFKSGAALAKQDYA